MKPIIVAASSINSTNVLSFVAMPVGPRCFYPASALVDAMLIDVDNVSRDDRFFTVYDEISPWRSASTYCPPRNSEDLFTRENLQKFMCQIALDRQDLSVQQETQISTKIQFHFAKETSKPEPVICYNFGNDNYVGLIGSEAKSLTASHYVAFAQAVSLSCDLALHLLTFGLSREQVIVPFIVTSWEYAQIGFIYLVADSFPCSSMISKVFNFNDHEDLVALTAWIIALGKHCSRMIEIIKGVYKPKKRKLESDRSGDDDNRCVLSRTSYICKPLDVESQHSRSALTHLLGIFFLLWSNESVRQYVVFPAGVIGYPDKNSQEELFNGINSSILSFHDLKGPSEVHVEFYPGQPIILYDELLASDGWKRGEKMVEEDNEVKRLFLAELKNITVTIQDTGIIHFDLRLFNLFYRFALSDL